MTNLTLLEKFRSLTIEALFMDDDLMDILVLKGGNALELAYKLNERASVDIDVSMEKDFDSFDLTLEEVEEKIFNNLRRVFSEKEYVAFDFELNQKPSEPRVYGNLHWGGYKINFKVISSKDFKRLDGDLEKIRRESMTVSNNKKKISIDISKYEFIQPSQSHDFNDLTIKVYTPKMIVFEKLRAICQQMKEYTSIVQSTQTPRARDFYDIYTILTKLDPDIDFRSSDSLEMITSFFGAKQVPLHLLNNVKDSSVYDLHKSGYKALEDSVKHEIKEFDYYYNFVLEKISEINLPITEKTL